MNKRLLLLNAFFTNSIETVKKDLQKSDFFDFQIVFI